MRRRKEVKKRESRGEETAVVEEGYEGHQDKLESFVSSCLPCLPHCDCGFVHVCVSVCVCNRGRARVGEREVPHQGNELKGINREEKRNSAKMGGNKSPLIESSF